MIPELLYGTAWKEERTAALTELAVRTGFRAIDSANQRRHYFEARGDRRSKLSAAPEWSRARTFFCKRLAGSLEHLVSGYVDSYVLHGPCIARKIIYQGFSLLTANADIVRHPPAQMVFSFAQSIGILPLTGTSDARHMEQDLAISGIPLAPDEVRTLETLAG